jgi:archaellum component FlaC
MVTTTEIGQLAGECNLWLDTLRSFRNRFNNHRSDLQSICGNQTQKDILLEVEHLHNQFHIQLINIHDLKQSIKRHMQQINFERRGNGHISDDVLARHEYLYDEYQRLETTLHIISREFERFAKYMSVKA